MIRFISRATGSAIAIGSARLVLLALLATLVGCGGGSSGDSGSSNDGGSSGDSGSSGDDGSSGDGGSSSNDDISVTGVVVDGYLQDAIAYLDLNDNKVLDENEPSAITDATGSYTLSGVSAADVVAHSVVVDVPAEAIDSDSGAAVGKAYLLSAPAGKPELISPLTTLILEMLERYPEMPLATAEAYIKANLGIGSQVSLFSDYIADGASTSSTANDSRKIHNIARVIAEFFGRNTESIKTALGGSIAVEKRGPVTRLIVWEAIEQLPSIESSLSSIELSSAEVTVLSINMTQIDITSIEATIAQQPKSKAVNAFDVLQGDGVYLPYGISYDEGGGYINQKTDGPNRTSYSVSLANFVFIGGQPLQLPPENNISYILTPAGDWIEFADRSLESEFQENADGDTTFSDGVLGGDWSFFTSQIDLSGLPIQSLKYIAIELPEQEIRFPDGASAYRFLTYPNQTEYEVSLDDQGFNPDLIGLTTLDQIVQLYSDGVDGKDLQISNLRVRLSGDGKIQNNVGGTALQPIGTWVIENVNGVDLLMLKIPSVYKAEDDFFLGAATTPFVTVVNGQGVLGREIKPGVPVLDELVFLNKAALDAVLANATEPTPEPEIEVPGRVVADGTISGATVFLDLNDNSLLDEGEPSEETRADGTYTLVWNEYADFTKHSVVALIPADASSVIDGVARPVLSAYKLIAPTEVFVITPMTTLIWREMYSNQNTTLRQAELSIEAMLNLSGPGFLLENYIQALPTPDQKKTNRVAAMVAYLLQQAVLDANRSMQATGDPVVVSVFDTNSLPFLIASAGASKNQLPSIVAGIESTDENSEPDEIYGFFDRETFSIDWFDLFIFASNAYDSSPELMAWVAEKRKQVNVFFIEVFAPNPLWSCAIQLWIYDDCKAEIAPGAYLIIN